MNLPAPPPLSIYLHFIDHLGATLNLGFFMWLPHAIFTVKHFCNWGHYWINRVCSFSRFLSCFETRRFYAFISNYYSASPTHPSSSLPTTLPRPYHNPHVYVSLPVNALVASVPPDFPHRKSRPSLSAVCLLSLTVKPKIRKGSRTQGQIQGKKTLVYFSPQGGWRRPVFSEITREMIWFLNLSISTMCCDR